jgi:hypothetical protein
LLEGKFWLGYNLGQDVLDLLENNGLMQSNGISSNQQLTIQQAIDLAL